MGFLRQLFGPSREEIWRQLSAEIGAQYVEGGFWKGGKVQAHQGQWTITLDTYTETQHNSTPSATGIASSSETITTYTRMRAPYVNKDGFRFTIYRKGVFSGLGKLLGMQDVEVGFPEFDDAFIIKGNDEAKLRALFANPKIRQLIAMQPSIHLTVKDDEGWFGAALSPGRGRTLLQCAGRRQGRGAVEVALLSLRRNPESPVPHRVGLRERPATGTLRRDRLGRTVHRLLARIALAPAKPGVVLPFS